MTDDDDALQQQLLELTEVDIVEFRTIIREELGVEASPGEARAQATNLLRLVHLVATFREPDKNAADTPGKTANPAHIAESQILQGLSELFLSLRLIRPRSKDWAWPVRVTHQLLENIFRERIGEAAQEHQGEHVKSWEDEDLLGLASRLRIEGVPSDESWGMHLKRLERLVRERDMMTVGLWALLGVQLPQLLRQCLEIGEVLTWGRVESTRLSPKVKEAAAATAAGIRDRLLILELAPLL